MLHYKGILTGTLCAVLMLLSWDESRANGSPAQSGSGTIEFLTPADLENMVNTRPAASKAKTVVEEKSKLNVPLDPVLDVAPTAETSVPVTQTPRIARYQLGKGDKIKVTVFGENDLSGTFLINEEGYVSLPLIGEFAVSGLTVQDVKGIIDDKLSDGYLVDPSIAIEVAEFRPIYVMGEVSSPGEYDFRTDMTVRNAVAMAGGFTYRAKQDNVKILRETSKNVIFEIQGVGPDVRIAPGDTIMIKERFF
ncbi:MAG: polysaccharide biosynthesis/export family protein [Alphaproteobacteria bacterium]